MKRVCTDIYFVREYYILHTLKHLFFRCLYPRFRSFLLVFFLKTCWKGCSQVAIATMINFSQIGCMGFSCVVTITPCEHLHGIPYNPFDAIKNRSRNHVIRTVSIVKSIRPSCEDRHFVTYVYWSRRLPEFPCPPHFPIRHFWMTTGIERHDEMIGIGFTFD